MKLGQGRRSLRGVVVQVGSTASGSPSQAFELELEKRLLEIGLVEGAQVEILHEGFIGRDPIAVRVDSVCVALRRHEANAVIVASETPEPRVLAGG
ncbi:MAG: FeoA domain-containing protein [Hoeflea sp.]|nr:FeoA domain-containing protein [Hoeflea sp.]